MTGPVTAAVQVPDRVLCLVVYALMLPQLSVQTDVPSILKAKFPPCE